MSYLALTVNILQQSDVETGKEIITLKPGGESLAFSPNGNCIASGSNDGTIRLWDVETGAEIMKLKGHNLWILSLAFSPDGKRLISTSRDRILKLWDISVGKEVFTRTQFRGTTTFSPNGKTIAVTGEHGIALLESDPPSDGYQAWRNGIAARKVVDTLHEKLGLYSEVIETLKNNDTLEESVCKLAVQIANARLWEDEEKKQ